LGFDAQQLTKKERQKVMPVILFGIEGKLYDRFMLYLIAMASDFTIDYKIRLL
tara:strand:- start:393 stop:551 length:159 start_codon:yes stop_codon:yes gene_type:complete